MDYAAFQAKAEENRQAAQLCFDHKLFNASANRAYYAMYHAAVAILLAKGIAAQASQFDHSWVQSTLARELVNRTKSLASKFRSFLPDAQKNRIIADYDTVTISQTKAQRQLSKAKEFIDAIMTELNNA